MVRWFDERLPVIEMHRRILPDRVCGDLVCHTGLLISAVTGPARHKKRTEKPDLDHGLGIRRGRIQHFIPAGDQRLAGCRLLIGLQQHDSERDIERLGRRSGHARPRHDG